MSSQTRVFLDPDGTLPYLLGVIIAHPAGVHYEHQCAGIETLQRSAEGYFVPLGGLCLTAELVVFDPGQLTEVFHQRGACAWGGQPRNLPPNTSLLPQDRLDRLQSLVAAIPYWTHDGSGSDLRSHLQLDETRLGELAEAWVPVLTPDGRGILVWENCD